MEPERQIIYRNGVALDIDHKTLAWYGIDAGTTIHVKDAGEQIPLRLSKMLRCAGPPMLFYFFSNNHIAVYEFLLGYKYVNEVNREIVIYEEGTAQ